MIGGLMSAVGVKRTSQADPLAGLKAAEVRNAKN